MPVVASALAKNKKAVDPTKPVAAASGSSVLSEEDELAKRKHQEKYRDEANYTHPWAKQACRAAHYINHEIVLSDGFNNFVICCIMLAGVIVGIQTYPYYPKTDCDGPEYQDFDNIDPCNPFNSPTTTPTVAPTAYRNRDPDKNPDWSSSGGYNYVVPASVMIDFCVT